MALDRRLIATVLAVLSLTAGCIGSQGDESPTTPAEPTNRPAPETPKTPDPAQATITGELVTKDQSPVPDAQIQLAETNRSTETDANGSFTFEAVPPGNHTIHAAKPDFQTVETETTLADGEQAQVTLETIYTPGWPPVEEALVRPGAGIGEPDAAEVVEDRGSCTANFVFHSPGNQTLYIGTAGHCVDHRELGDTIALAGGRANGTLVYSSHHLPDRVQELYDVNDFALIAIASEDRELVHPAMVAFGGPTGIVDRLNGTPPGGEALPGDELYLAGKSDLRQGLDPADRMRGITGNWTQARTWARFAPAPVFGDSGAPVMRQDGLAVGLAQGLSPLPDDGETRIVNLSWVLAIAERHTELDVTLATWPTFPSEEPPTASDGTP